MASVGLWQTVTGLDTNSRYEFKVMARYRGASSIVESRSVTAKTKACKCAVLTFRYRVSQVKQVKQPLINNCQL